MVVGSWDDNNTKSALVDSRFAEISQALDATLWRTWPALTAHRANLRCAEASKYSIRANYLKKGGMDGTYRNHDSNKFCFGGCFVMTVPAAKHTKVSAIRPGTDEHRMNVSCQVLAGPLDHRKLCH